MTTSTPASASSSSAPASAWVPRLRALAWATAAGLLLVPLVALQLTREVQWTGSDFAAAAVLLFGAAFAFHVGTARGGGAGVAHAVGVGLAVVTALLLVWVNLAVGVIGDEGNAANLLYVGVVGVVAGGAIASRGAADGLVRALVAAMALQVAVPVVALVVGVGVVVDAPQVIGVTAFFVALWGAAAALLRRAG